MLSTLAHCRKLCPQMEPQFALCFEGRLSAQLERASVPVYSLGAVRARNVLSLRRARSRLIHVIKSNQIDVVICHGIWSQALLGSAARKAGVTQIFWQHDIIVRKGWMEAVAARVRPDLIIANSNYSKSTTQGLFGETPTSVLYCPIELFNWTAFKAKRDDTRRQLNTPVNRCVITQVSRLHSGKGHKLHLAALAQLRHLQNWECWMVGGPQRSDEKAFWTELQSLCLDLGIDDRVRFLGERDDVPRLLAASDICCQPNTGPEAFGLSFVEALAMGVPVVTTDMNAASEIINESCGILAEPDNATRLAAALALLLQNDAERVRLGHAGPKRAKQLCDAERQLNRLADILANARCKSDVSQDSLLQSV